MDWGGKRPGGWLSRSPSHFFVWPTLQSRSHWLGWCQQNIRNHKRHFMRSLPLQLLYKREQNQWRSASQTNHMQYEKLQNICISFCLSVSVAACTFRVMAEKGCTLLRVPSAVPLKSNMHLHLCGMVTEGWICQVVQEDSSARGNFAHEQIIGVHLPV